MFLIRPAEAKDLDGIAVCFAQGFFDLKIQAEILPFVRDLVSAILPLGDIVLVAQTRDGKVGGYLVAGYQKPTLKKLYPFFCKAAVAGFKYFIGAYCFSPEARREIRLFCRRAAHLKTKCKADAEILNLSSLKDCRTGIGTALMDAVVKDLKRQGCKDVKVLTESTVNYRFYEKYGFVLAEEYDMDLKESQNSAKVYLLNL